MSPRVRSGAGDAGDKRIPTRRQSGAATAAGARKKAGKIKTTSGQKCNMAEMRATAMNNGETVRPLRRGLNQAPGRRAVEQMARAACFSRRQFHRLMVQHFGEAPGSHQRRLRLDRSAWLLLTSHLTILDIALETGFESHETFTRAFRTRFRETPSSFRKNRGSRLPQSIRLGFAIAANAATERRNYSPQQ